ncbi:YD repeat-containing protein OS=Streptomyces glaucescens OX=1907 GN=SGLAU_00860 PE=4 SV=1 [Streptomyces glaucescens]
MPAKLKAPINSDSGNKRLEYVLKSDLEEDHRRHLAVRHGEHPAAGPNVRTNPTSDQLGLEDFYSYAGKNTGAARR